jgi:hypothetical protein
VAKQGSFTEAVIFSDRFLLCGWLLLGLLPARLDYFRTSGHYLNIEPQKVPHLVEH